MKGTALLVGLLAIAAMPVLASQQQLAQAAGVEPGVYSNAQLIRLKSLQREGGNRFEIQRILANPQGAPLVGRLSTTTHEPAND